MCEADDLQRIITLRKCCAVSSVEDRMLDFGKKLAKEKMAKAVDT